eukprot:CAMPEP_0201705556 /NCGR_PEP_ID=MMETSP0578-20130828/46160_1 /ASSEMBLY_ACC=CAM_ASM_000663 /TAXON_ID=267565 /ORGANISM="Skeletonema grethea, Strain CCMP 1804" /LENGTH=457 /DNA_ID=CAMNT_0048193813 /DNA_START=38 /DNA_END=1411 /DNA_ORIENTATION=-
MTAARGTRSNLAVLSVIIAAAAGLLTAVITITVSELSGDYQQRRFLQTNNDGAALPTDYIEDEDEPPIEEESLIAMQFAANPYAGRDKIDMIKSGEAKLASLRLSPDSLSEGSSPQGSNSYTGVYGIFCVFDDQLNKKHPAVYPTFDHMVQTSNHCIENRYTLPLDEVVEAVISHDKKSIRNNERLKKLPLSGMLFHQGFSGAGLIANALTTFDDTVVISEHSAIRDALNACDYLHNRFNSNDCSSLKHQKLIEDVISLLSRSSNSSIEHMFLKLDSASSAYIPLLRAIYPDSKWTFDYRKAEHVLAKSTEPKRNTCVLKKRQPSSVMASQALEHNVVLEELSTHEVCALHLSTLIDVASREHESTGTGMLISYEDDLLQEDALLGTILPYLGLQQEIDANPSMARARVEEVLSTKANLRGIHSQDVDSQWGVGSEEHVHVSDEVRAASQLFMQNIM